VAITSQPESKLTARLFLRAKQAKERVKEVADWVSWANSSVAFSRSGKLSLAAIKRNMTIFLPIQEGKKSKGK